MIEPIEIFFATDDNFVQHLCVSIASILYNAAEEDVINVYIMTSGLKEENVEKIKGLSQIKSFNLEIINIDDSLFSKYKSPDYISSSTTFYRYLIPELKPELNKVLYLDCDIVVKQSLQELFNIDIQDYYIAGVEDVHFIIREKQLYLDFNVRESYFNAGVLLFNCELMRKDNLSKKMFVKSEELNTKCHLGADQDVINIICQGKKKLLDLKYNLLSASFDDRHFSIYSKKVIEDAIANPVIIHYTDRRKPWMHEGFPLNDLAYEYHRYLSLTSFDNTDFEKNLALRHRKLEHCWCRLRDNLVFRIFKGLFYIPKQVFDVVVAYIDDSRLLKDISRIEDVKEYRKRILL